MGAVLDPVTGMPPPGPVVVAMTDGCGDLLSLGDADGDLVGDLVGDADGEGDLVGDADGDGDLLGACDMLADGDGDGHLLGDAGAPTDTARKPATAVMAASADNRIRFFTQTPR